MFVCSGCPAGFRFHDLSCFGCWSESKAICHPGIANNCFIILIIPLRSDQAELREYLLINNDRE